MNHETLELFLKIVLVLIGALGFLLIPFIVYFVKNAIEELLELDILGFCVEFMVAIVIFIVSGIFLSIGSIVWG